MGKVYVFAHPLIQHKVALMRDKNTTVRDFRQLAKEIAMLMGYEATRELPLEDVEIETPMCKTSVKMLKGEDIAIVPILRAGLGFVEGMLELVPNAKVGHVGVQRDENTHVPIEYYCIWLRLSLLTPHVFTGQKSSEFGFFRFCLKIQNSV